MEPHNNPRASSSNPRIDTTPSSTQIPSVSSSPALSWGSGKLKTPLSPILKTKELLSSSSEQSSSSNSQISSGDLPLPQTPPNLGQEDALPSKSSHSPGWSNPDIGDLEVLTSLLSTLKDKLQITSGIHSPPTCRPSRPPPLVAANSLQSDHILHERWCEKCRKSFYGTQCESHVSVNGGANLSDSAVQPDISSLDSNGPIKSQVLEAGDLCSPKDILIPVHPPVIIQQFGASKHPATSTIILNYTHSKPSADHCATCSSPLSCSHANAPIIIQGSSIFEGDDKICNRHTINRRHCHCQVSESLLRSNSSSGSPHASEDSDDDRWSCTCVRHQRSRSPSPPESQSDSKRRITRTVRNISHSPPRLGTIASAHLPSRYADQPDWPHSEKYYFEDGTVLFRVGMLLYKVHRHFFDRYSIFFHDLFSTINLNARDIDDPIVLAEIEPRDFDCLLSIFYPKSFDKSDLSTADWTSILYLSTRWSFTDIRQSAVNHLASNSITTAVEKIVLGTKYTVKEWLAPAYEEVCLRGRSLDLEEGARLGSERVSKITKLRMEFGLEKVMGMGSEGEPCGGGEARARDPIDAPARIRQMFGLD